MAAIVRRETLGRSLLLGSLALGIGWVWLLLGGGDAPRYSISVEQALERRRAGRFGRTFRIQGVLVPGSARASRGRCVVDFRIGPSQGYAGPGSAATHSDPPTLPVRLVSCVAPINFCDLPLKLQELSIEGRFGKDGVTFYADTVLAKCPSKYEIGRDPCAGWTKDAYCPPCEHRPSSVPP